VVIVSNISLKLCRFVFIFYNYQEIKIDVLRGGKLAEYINKNGLPVGTSAKELFEELMRGTGFVMGPNVSLFIENAGLHDKNIVVSRMPGRIILQRLKYFQSINFKVQLIFLTVGGAKIDVLSSMVI
tara:strand:+ start:234 stop:614 length:381 start_codon:yes stop_codon:yes gene_type:complete